MASSSSFVLISVAFFVSFVCHRLHACSASRVRFMSWRPCALALQLRKGDAADSLTCAPPLAFTRSVARSCWRPHPGSEWRPLCEVAMSNGLPLRKRACKASLSLVSPSQVWQASRPAWKRLSDRGSIAFVLDGCPGGCLSAMHVGLDGCAHSTRSVTFSPLTNQLYTN